VWGYSTSATQRRPRGGVVGKPTIQLPGKYSIAGGLWVDTFATLKGCGAGRRECQILWVGPWADLGQVSRVVHPVHAANGGGFQLDETWLNAFLFDLARRGEGVRVQVHTHPGSAFHSKTDDDWPIVHTPRFLSLVIPRFATKGPTFSGAYLTELQTNGQWKQVKQPESRIRVEEAD
jgi:hypothetical protein